MTHKPEKEKPEPDHLHFFACMDRVNRVMQKSEDLESMMSDVLDAALDLFACDRAFLLYPCDPDSATWRSPMERTRPEFPGALAMGAVTPINAEFAQLFRDTLKANNPLKIFPESDYALSADVHERFGVKALMIMALFPKVGKPWAFGIQQCSYRRAWSDEEARLLQGIGVRMADSLTSLLVLRDLQESQERLENAQRIAHVGSWERDYATAQTTLSNEVCHIFGLPTQRSFPLEQWHQKWLSLIHPEDRQQVSEAYSRARQGGTRYEQEYRAIRPDGEVRFLYGQSDVVAWDQDGTPMRMFGTVQDITERKRAEEEIRKLNESLEQRVKERTAELQRAYEDLKATQAHMLQQEKMASIGQLAAGVAHEINNPIGYIISNLRMLERYGKTLLAFQQAQHEALDQLAATAPETAKKLTLELKHRGEELEIEEVAEDFAPLVAESLEGANRIKEIVQNLRDFARLDETDYKMSDINMGLENTLKMLGQELKSKATVEKAYGEIPETLCHGGQLNQVFMSLLTNAVQAIEGTGKITIRTWQENGKILISIADTGCGIPPDQIKRIFEPFFTTKEVGAGTGLGLSVAYNIIKTHGGEFAVASRPGEGTQFIINLPIRSLKAL